MTAEIKCVFGFRRNTVDDEADVMSSGRLLHSFGSAEANDRSPTVTRRDGRTVSWLEIDNRSHLRDRRHVSNAGQPIRQISRRSLVKSSVDRVPRWGHSWSGISARFPVRLPSPHPPPFPSIFVLPPFFRALRSYSYRDAHRSIFVTRLDPCNSQ